MFVLVLKSKFVNLNCRSLRLRGSLPSFESCSASFHRLIFVYPHAPLIPRVIFGIGPRDLCSNSLASEFYPCIETSLNETFALRHSQLEVLALESFLSQKRLERTPRV